jgi:hypothetical protein
MSGSDGAPVGPGGFEVGADEDDCHRVTVDAPVDSPSPEEPFEVGNQYDVVIIDAGPAPTVRVLNESGQPVGAIRPFSPLVRCLRKGVLFYAEIESIDGGDVRVRVRPRP